jgi:hypothetical protein
LATIEAITGNDLETTVHYSFGTWVDPLKRGIHLTFNRAQTYTKENRMTTSPNLQGNINDGITQLEKILKEAIAGCAVGSAVILNATTEPVTFFVYNYIDTVYWVPAQQTLVAPGTCGTVAASGVQFKVHPNNNKDYQFLVAPKTGYLYGGPGNVSAAK